MRFAVLDLLVAQIILSRAVVSAADHRFDAGELRAGDQSQRAAAWTGEHGPVGILGVSEGPRIFQHKKRARFHLLWYPLLEQLQFRCHVLPPSLCPADHHLAEAKSVPSLLCDAEWRIRIACCCCLLDLTPPQSESSYAVARCFPALLARSAGFRLAGAAAGSSSNPFSSTRTGSIASVRL